MPLESCRFPSESVLPVRASMLAAKHPEEPRANIAAHTFEMVQRENTRVQTFAPGFANMATHFERAVQNSTSWTLL